MHVEDLAFAVRRLFRNDGREALGRMARAEAVARREHARRYDESALIMRALGCSGARTVCLGQSVDSGGAPFPVLLPAEEAFGGGHMLFTGATGGGKTALAIILLAQLLALEPARSSQLIIEPKRDLAPFVADVLLPCLLKTLPEADAEALAARFVHLKVFDPASPVPFQVLTRDPTLTTDEQSVEVTTSFTRTVGLRSIGPLQEAMLRSAFIVGIAAGLTVEDVVRFLRDEAFRRQILPHVPHPAARDYFLRQFPRERASGLASLLNRMDSLLAVPGLRRLLGSRGIIRFPDLLEGRVTVIDLGGAPAGMREAQRFIGELMVARLVRAIVARRVTPETVPVGIWMDEFQHLLTPELAADAEQVLSQARSQLCFLRILHQSGAQFSDPSFLRILRSQSNYHALFRADEQDARYLEAFLPAVREPPGPGETPDEGEAGDKAARRALLETVPRLPDRAFLWWDKRRNHPAILARTPTYPFRTARTLARSVPRGPLQELRTLALKGLTEAPDVDPSPEEPAVQQSADRSSDKPVRRRAGRAVEEPAPIVAGPEQRPRRVRLG